LGTTNFLLNYKFKFISSFIIIINTNVYNNLLVLGLNNINVWLSIVIMLIFYIIFYHYIYVYLFVFIYNIIDSVIKPLYLIFNFFCIDLSLLNLYFFKLAILFEFILYYYFLFFLFIL